MIDTHTHSDIKDLHVVNPAPTTVTAAPPSQPQDPAILAVNAAAKKAQQSQPQPPQQQPRPATGTVAPTYAPAGTHAGSKGAPSYAQQTAASVQPQQKQQQQQDRTRQPRPAYNASNSGAINTPAQLKPLPKEDFDFQSANAKLDKAQLIKEAKHKQHGGTNADAVAATMKGLALDDDHDEDETFYDKKSSFFDNISSDVKDRIEGVVEYAVMVDGVYCI